MYAIRSYYAFTAVEKEDIALPVWKDPEMLGIGKELLQYLLIAGIIV